MMRQRISGKAVATESKYPYIVELFVADDKLDVKFSRQTVIFVGLGLLLASLDFALDAGIVAMAVLPS